MCLVFLRHRPSFLLQVPLVDPVPLVLKSGPGHLERIWVPLGFVPRYKLRVVKPSTGTDRPGEGVSTFDGRGEVCSRAPVQTTPSPPRPTDLTVSTRLAVSLNTGRPLPSTIFLAVESEPDAHPIPNVSFVATRVLPSSSPSCYSVQPQSHRVGA